MKLNQNNLPDEISEAIDQYLFGTGMRLTESQKSLFLAIARTYRLNPLKREIHCVAYGNQFSIVVGYEVYLKRAAATGLLEWWEAGVNNIEGEWVGYCVIKRRDWSRPLRIEAWFNEYRRDTAIWREKPRTMIRKVAICQAFRLSFPQELGGLPYAPEELGTVEAQIISPPAVPAPEITDLAPSAPPTIPDLPPEEQAEALDYLAQMAAKSRRPVEQILQSIQSNPAQRSKFISAYRKHRQLQPDSNNGEANEQ